MADIVVTGRRVKAVTPEPPSAGVNYYGMGGAFNYEEGSGSSSSPPDTTPLQEFIVREESAKDTPCVQKPPLGAILSKVNNHAKAIESEIRALSDGNEFATIIYEWSGEVYQLPIYTSGNSGRTGVDTDSLPAGANIVGIIHNHPARNVADDRLPSPGDRNVYDDLIRSGADNPTSNFYTDPYLLMYIFDEQTGQTYVYDRDSYRIEQVTCTI